MNVMNFNRFNHLLFALLFGVVGSAGAQAPNINMLYTYTLSGAHTADAYHEIKGAVIWDPDVPGQVIAALNELWKSRPELDIEVVDPYNFFHLFKSTEG